jgi:hypothetical protein
MKFLATLFSLVPALQLLAQPVITMNELVPAMGPAPVMYYVLDVEEAVVGPALADFVFTVPDTLLLVYEEYQQFMPASGTPFATSFPMANLASNGYTGDDDLTYYQVTDDAIYLLGSITPTWIDDTLALYYTDPEKLFEYPISYSASFSDTWLATDASGDTLKFGDTNVIYNGHGTLILPFGTFNNVARIQTTQSGEARTNPSGVNFWFSVVTVSYYSSGLNSFLYRSVEGFLEYDLGFGSLEWFMTGMADPFTVGLYTHPHHSSKLHLFPNPATGTTTLTFPQHMSERSHVRVMDVMGREVRKFDIAITGNRQLILNLEGLATGSYQIWSADGSGSTAHAALHVE